MIKICRQNIMETSVATLSAGQAGSAIYRLYDRNVSRPFRAQSAGAIEISIDQGGSPMQVDTLIIPEGHNLSGADIRLLRSDDGITYQDVAQAEQEGGGIIVLEFPPVSSRFFRFRVESPAVAPEFSELFISPAHGWEKDPPHPIGPLEPEFQVETALTAGGSERYLISGPPKRKRKYSVQSASKELKDMALSAYESWAGAKPFYLCDHEGQWIFGGLRGGLNLKENGFEKFSFDFDFVEAS